MSIECTIQCTLGTEHHTLDLEDYLGDFGSFVDELYQEFNLESPVDINTHFEVVDTDYFNSMEDVEQFLSIKFAYGYLPNIYLAWLAHTGNAFENFKLFNDVFLGQFQEPKDFCREYIEKETALDTMPTCIRDCVDYGKMWDNHLSNHFYSLKVEDANFSDISMYVYAIFK